MTLKPYDAALKLANSDDWDASARKILEYLEIGVVDNDPRALCARAMCYVDGKYGSEVNDSKAMKLFLKLSSSHVPEALFALAVSYDTGDGVGKDEFKALSYYLRAATLGHSEACFQVSEYFREGKHIKRDKELEIFWLERSNKDEREVSPRDRIWLT